MADLVESVLAQAAEKEARFKTIEVEKDIELDIDVGNLLAVDTNPLDEKQFRSQKKEEFLLNLTRDNTQLLLNSIWKLPAERVDEAVIVKLPEPTTILPREKPVPKDLAPTKWESYARLKGIQKRKRGRMIWDEQAKDWKPRMGYKRGNDDTKEWLIEVPDNADPYEDQFAKRNKAKKERIAKNELQRLRNVARNMKGKVPGVGLTPTEKPQKDDLSRALHAAGKSTASMGKFTERLPKEKPSKNEGRRRKFESNVGSLSDEKKRNLALLSKMEKNWEQVNAEKAASQYEHKQDIKRAAEKNDKANKHKGKRKGKRGGKEGKSGQTRLKRKPFK